jgi:hypothetical protein
MYRTMFPQTHFATETDDSQLECDHSTITTQDHPHDVPMALQSPRALCPARPPALFSHASGGMHARGLPPHHHRPALGTRSVAGSSAGYTCTVRKRAAALCKHINWARAGVDAGPHTPDSESVSCVYVCVCVCVCVVIIALDLSVKVCTYKSNIFENKDHHGLRSKKSAKDMQAK